MKKFVAFLFSLLALVSNQSEGQVTVQQVSPVQAVQNVFLGQGVSVSNVNFIGGSLGIFNGINSNLGLASGLLLTTGSSASAIGPNNSTSSSTNLNLTGHPILTNLANGYGTYDANILEFDFVPVSDTIQFRYIFGSEEYPEYAPPQSAQFNDVFAFMITGPGYPQPTNIALIPGTTTPVSINNINAITNSQYYIDNSTLGGTVGFDGFTTVLTAKAAVTPCQTYHIQLMIADVFDGVYDSGVFLEAGSFGSTVANANGILGSFTNLNCGSSQFQLNFSHMMQNSTVSVSDFSMPGYTINSITPVGTANSSQFLVNVSPAIAACGNVTLFLQGSVQDVCGNTFNADTLSINLPGITVNSTTYSICPGETLTLNPQINIANCISNVTYSWNNSSGLSSTTIPNPTVITNQSQAYQLTISNGVCSATGNFFVHVNDTTGNSVGTINASGSCNNLTIHASNSTGILEWFVSTDNINWTFYDFSYVYNYINLYNLPDVWVKAVGGPCKEDTSNVIFVQTGGSISCPSMNLTAYSGSVFSLPINITGYPATLLINYGDGTTDSVVVNQGTYNLTHTYQTAGFYSLYIQYQNQNGCYYSCYSYVHVDPYVITGMVYEDFNLNGTYDIGEPGVPNVLVTANQWYYAITDNDGYYSLYVGDTGTYNVFVFSPTYYFSIPSFIQVQLSGTSSYGNDFGLQQQTGHNDVRVF
ncbi:MAG: choice-of-anchor L domain-containing protein, partial [Bacteroidia bacterium]|nr:choice-of-anchor L domain-containing protein [Bacteroidia bacterium]